MENLLALDAWILGKTQQFTNFLSDTFGMSRESAIRFFKILTITIGLLINPAYCILHKQFGNSLVSMMIFLNLYLLLRAYRHTLILPRETIRLIYVGIIIIYGLITIPIFFSEDKTGIFFSCFCLTMMTIFALIAYLEENKNPPKKKSWVKRKKEELSESWQGLWQPKPRLAMNARSPRSRGLPLFSTLLPTLYELRTS